jgi:hypothetical protein
MHLREELLKEHSVKQAKKIAAWAAVSAENFHVLMECFMDSEYRIAQRAAWSVSKIAETKPALLVPYIEAMVNRLEATDVHPAVIRNTVRVFEKIRVPEPLHGKLMTACFGFLESVNTPVAIKAFSLTILFHLSEQYPDISQELKLLIVEKWDTETAAFKSRGRKILAALEKRK